MRVVNFLEERLIRAFREATLLIQKCKHTKFLENEKTQKTNLA